MVKEVNSKYAQFNGHLKFGFNQQLSSECYAVESPESFIPAQPSDGAVILRYCENDYPAGTAMSSTTHKAVVLGFPFETITDPSDRLKLMKQIMAFLTLQPRHLSAQDSIKVFAGTLIAPEEISLSSEAYTVNGMPLFMRDPAKPQRARNPSHPPQKILEANTFVILNLPSQPSTQSHLLQWKKQISPTPAYQHIHSVK